MFWIAARNLTGRFEWDQDGSISSTYILALLWLSFVSSTFLEGLEETNGNILCRGFFVLWVCPLPRRHYHDALPSERWMENLKVTMHIIGTLAIAAAADSSPPKDPKRALQNTETSRKEYEPGSGIHMQNTMSSKCFKEQMSLWAHWIADSIWPCVLVHLPTIWKPFGYYSSILSHESHWVIWVIQCHMSHTFIRPKTRISGSPLSIGDCQRLFH